MSELKKEDVLKLYEIFSSPNAEILRKIAQKTTQEEFVKFITTNEIPPVALTDKEMEAVRGGNLITWIMKIVKKSQQYIF